MSIYIVQGWGRGFLGCRRRPRPREELPPRQPLGPSARALLVWPAGSTSGFHFSLRSETKRQKTRENNKTLQCEVNGAVRSVGRAGLGRSKRARRDWRRGEKVGRPPLGRRCIPGAAVELRQRAELRGRAAPARAAKARAGLRRRGAALGPTSPLRSQRRPCPRPGAGLPLLATYLCPQLQPLVGLPAFFLGHPSGHPLLAPLGRWG